MGSQDDDQLLQTIYEFVEQKHVRVILNMAGVVWMNSLGIGKCIRGMTTLRTKGGDLRLACLTPPVQSLLEKCSMHKIFKIYSTVNEAGKDFK